MDKISKEDGELLELAAKAAGHKINWMKNGCGPYWISIGGDKEWNPLTDDGDALRLVIKLGLHVGVCLDLAVGDCSYVKTDCGKKFIELHHLSNPAEATRRAIVCAAAEIGKKL